MNKATVTKRLRRACRSGMEWTKVGARFRVEHEVDAVTRVWYVEVFTSGKWMSYAKASAEEVYNEIVKACARGEGPAGVRWEVA